jgi:hypothetical protein
LPGVAVVVAAEVEGCDSEVEAEPVGFYATESDSAVVVGDEPGDPAFNEWPILLVVFDAGVSPSECLASWNIYLEDWGPGTESREGFDVARSQSMRPR